MSAYRRDAEHLRELLRLKPWLAPAVEEGHRLTEASRGAHEDAVGLGARPSGDPPLQWFFRGVVKHEVADALDTLHRRWCGNESVPCMPYFLHNC